MIDSKKYRSVSDIDVGFAAKCHLIALTKDKKISDIEALEFKMDCLTFFSSVAKKYWRDLPWNVGCWEVYSVWILAQWPAHQKKCIKAFDVVLSKLIEAGWQTTTMADDLWEQYKSFILLIEKEDKGEIQECKERVDTFALVTTGIIRFCGSCVNYYLLFLSQSRKRFQCKHWSCNSKPKEWNYC